VRTILPDKLTAVTTSQAVTAALLARARTGEGQHVRVAMLDAVLQFLWSSDMAGQTFVGGEKSQAETASAIDLIYATSDGYISAAVQTNKQWEGLTRALDHPEWLTDPRFQTPALRQQNIDDRLRLTQETLLTRSSAEWLGRLTAEDVPCAPVLTRSEVIHHEQVIGNETLVESDHPTAGRLRQTRSAARFSATPASIRFGAPALGEHTDAILGELGYSTAEIAALKGFGT
jgi:crotonobetainyl-CoA:carnitine CoA-transferase CaiB-like acyl-CoA transferase